jgi:hypothetical protein
VKFPNGRLQTLPLCWDNRPKQKGGQRWFHIYPDQRIKPDDPLFWAGPMQNWNSQCAECHSTNLKKNYDPQEDAYHTTFAQIDVSCEACHGPGSKHLEWAEAEQGGWYGSENSDSADASGGESDGNKGSDDNTEQLNDMGLTVSLTPDEPVAWVQNPKTSLPQRKPPVGDKPRKVMQTCARCHARRSVMSEKFLPGDDWLQTHRPTLLEQPAYHVDGRIEGEVYVWGSFRQSKMYHKGVGCVDCHNAHSLELKLPKEQMCLRCHNGSKYDTPDHHFHKPESKGSSCINCHMPEETFMVVDDRRDHSFRIPRPDRSKKLGTPNTCNDCHQDKSVQWALKHYRDWWGEPKQPDKPWAFALDAAWEGQPGARRKLNRAAQRGANVAIARATALGRLQSYPARQSLGTIKRLIESDETLLRLAAVRALRAYQGQRQAQLRWRVGATALDDPSRLVRTSAARVLAGTQRTLPGANRSKRYQQALEELKASHRRNADQAATWVSRGNLQLALNRQDKAIEAYRTAIEQNVHYIAGYTNLADLYRRRNNEQQVQQVLKQGLARAPEAAPSVCNTVMITSPPLASTTASGTPHWEEWSS